MRKLRVTGVMLPFPASIITYKKVYFIKPMVLFIYQLTKSESISVIYLSFLSEFYRFIEKLQEQKNTWVLNETTTPVNL